MPNSIIYTVIFFTCIGTGILAGLFFSFSTFIMEALGEISAKSGMNAMKAINRTILNPLFGLIYFGTALMTLFLLVATLFNSEWNGRIYIISGSLLYLVGTFLVTIIFNVPLNNLLERGDSTDYSSQQMWRSYIKKWTVWNHIRTVTAVGTLACFVLGFKLL
ncbi:anthrone oxygenase family protein [Salipaludibacillus neizhouensis]|nr:anthrone oxygenase family protein [Salipaludibacillus neizhouensis]